ncbi:hypothetical protein ACQKMD_19925 [Viridibacillus sp. NPDC096237]|uniref:hypothetical protein n=1 Tax=Viridibacillus sp. NPDC096237 TaxID=3390721 RepID=UPI003D01BB78
MPNTFAKENNIDETDQNYTNILSNNNRVHEVQNVEEFAKENNIPLEKDGKELSEITISYTNNNYPNNLINESITPFATAEYYVTVVRTSETCGLETLRSSYYPEGPGTMTVSETVATNISVSATLDYKIISGSLGYDVTKSYTVSDSKTINVPKGKTWNLVARPMFETKEFTVKRNNKSYATGDSSKPIGVCFSIYK